jgi:hypothetical protein
VVFLCLVYRPDDIYGLKAEYESVPWLPSVSIYIDIRFKNVWINKSKFLRSGNKRENVPQGPLAERLQRRCKNYPYQLIFTWRLVLGMTENIRQSVIRYYETLCDCECIRNKLSLPLIFPELLGLNCLVSFVSEWISESKSFLDLR